MDDSTKLLIQSDAEALKKVFMPGCKNAEYAAQQVFISDDSIVCQLAEHGFARWDPDNKNKNVVYQEFSGFRHKYETSSEAYEQALWKDFQSKLQPLGIDIQQVTHVIQDFKDDRKTVVFDRTMQGGAPLHHRQLTYSIPFSAFTPGSIANAVTDQSIHADASKLRSDAKKTGRALGNAFIAPGEKAQIASELIAETAAQLPAEERAAFFRALKIKLPPDVMKGSSHDRRP